MGAAFAVPVSRFSGELPFALQGSGVVPPSGIEPAPSGLQPDAQTTYARGAWRSPWESNPPGSVGQTDRLTRDVGERVG